MDATLLIRRQILLLVLCAVPLVAEAPVRCGTAWLRAQKEAGDLALPLAAAAKVAQEATPIEVGTELLFPASGAVSLLSATCQRVGTHSYIFVENRMWDTNGGPVLQTHVDALGALFDEATPADPQRGVFEVETDLFGANADVDDDERVFLLVLDVPFSTNVVGYFDDSVATFAVPEFRRDVLFLDERFVRTQPRLARGTLAHEFQHMIHWNWDDDEAIWVDEGLSGYAEELTGFAEADPEAVPQFLSRPHTSLTDWNFDESARHYGVTYLFMSFLAQRYGPELLRSIIAQPRNGAEGIDAELAAHTADRFLDAWQTWSLGNATGDPAYDALADRRVQTFAIEGDQLPLQGVSGSVSGRWGTANILFRTAGSLTIDFDGEDAASFDVRVSASTQEGAQIYSIELDAENRGAVQVTGIDSAMLIVGRTSLQGESFVISARQSTPTAVTAVSDVVPHQAVLQAPYPNPFNSSVRVPVEGAGAYELTVYDMLGRSVRTLWAGSAALGSQVYTWDGMDEDGRAMASGTYLVKLKAGGQSSVRSLTLLR